MLKINKRRICSIIVSALLVSVFALPVYAEEAGIVPVDGGEIQLERSGKNGASIGDTLDYNLPGAAQSLQRASAVNNNSPGTAYPITDADLANDITGTATGNLDFYTFSATAATKITAFYEHPGSGDYDVFLTDSTFTILDISQESGTADERITAVVGPGTHYVVIQPYELAVAPDNGYAIRFYMPETFDSTESDDFPFQAQPFTGVATRTIDNPFDVDWMTIDVTDAGKYNLYLSSTEYRYNLYKLDNAAGTLAPLGYLPIVGSVSYVNRQYLDIGTYYIQIVSLSGVYSEAEEYTARFLRSNPETHFYSASFTVDNDGLSWDDPIAVEVFPNGELTVTVTGDGEEGVPYLVVYNPAGGNEDWQIPEIGNNMYQITFSDDSYYSEISDWAFYDEVYIVIWNRQGTSIYGGAHFNVSVTSVEPN